MPSSSAPIARWHVSLFLEGSLAAMLPLSMLLVGKSSWCLCVRAPCLCQPQRADKCRCVQNTTNGAFFTELVWAASTFKFAPDGIHIGTRDYMHGSIWDIRQTQQPLRTFEVHEHLGERLMDVYENESIFDRLGCAISPSGQHIALGSYCELCVFNQFSDTFTTLKSCGSPVVINVRPRAHI